VNANGRALSLACFITKVNRFILTKRNVLTLFADLPLKYDTMTSTRFLCTLLAVAIAFLATGSSAFAPTSQMSRTSAASSTTPLMGAFDGEQERKALTRESEPEEFFST
jgi:hypothetical protein